MHETDLLVRNGPTVQRLYNKKAFGCTPAIVLLDPKYPHNVGGAIRVASCYSIHQVRYTGNRVTLMDDVRVPREERMSQYNDVALIQYDRPFDHFSAAATPVAIEMRDNAESLCGFVHPRNAVYVFGPEDGGLGRVTLSQCHRFVMIPSKHCLNLTAAIATVLYDRCSKQRE